VLGAVPLAAALERRGASVHFANLSFTSLAELAGARAVAEAEGLYEVTGASAREDKYCPEAWLARERKAPIWCFEKIGVAPLRHAFRWLAARLGLDAVVLVDGGIDVLLRGDESDLGTPAEDLTSLAAVAGLDVPTRLIACVGLGAELRDGICHEQVFARIAELTRAGAFLGAWSLSGEVADAYRASLRAVFAGQQAVRRSHIHELVLAALDGEYGAVQGERRIERWVSPLLTLFWTFDLPGVASTSLLVPLVEDARTMWDVTVRIEAARKSMPLRERSAIPI
jgi:hypothetical protein